MIDEENYIESTDLGGEFLEHHGIKGMLWGKRNGPPYPLGGEDKKDFQEQKKAVMAAKKKKAPGTKLSRREKRLKAKYKNNPAEMVKHPELFNRREIEAANQKFEAINQAREYADIEQARKDAKKQEKLIKKAEKQYKKDTTLSKKQEKWAKDPITLERNAKKFTPQQMQLALGILDTQNKLYDAKINKLAQPLKAFRLVEDYSRTAMNTVNNCVNTYDKLAERFQFGLNTQDAYAKAKYTKGSKIYDQYTALQRIDNMNKLNANIDDYNAYDKLQRKENKYKIEQNIHDYKAMRDGYELTYKDKYERDKATKGSSIYDEFFVKGNKNSKPVSEASIEDVANAVKESLTGQPSKSQASTPKKETPKEFKSTFKSQLSEPKKETSKAKSFDSFLPVEYNGNYSSQFNTSYKKPMVSRRTPGAINPFNIPEQTSSKKLSDIQQMPIYADFNDLFYQQGTAGMPIYTDRRRRR